MLQDLLNRGMLEEFGLMTPALCEAVMRRYEERLTERDDAIAKDVRQLAAVVMGTPKTNLEGGGRNRDGLVHSIDAITSTLSNGGVKIRLPVPVWVAIVTVVGSVIAEAIGLIGG